ncbi:hypothetical protein Dsin_015404 [Dipteronia sinensis]|uniref:Uncharacterized protein n=1 Tax=Dipteronia sinensis TaxID=43782 RepID=A0AAE0E5X7_9ROSI|nr:hypothetical protein Dsin_015404 [Dipteronia sinensis]
MASGAAEMVLGCVFNRSLSLHELNVERRPYHKNCSCALHDLKGVCSSNTCSKKNNLSFQKTHEWNSTEKQSLSLSASEAASHRLLNRCSSRDEGNSIAYTDYQPDLAYSMPEELIQPKKTIEYLRQVISDQNKRIEILKVGLKAVSGNTPSSLSSMCYSRSSNCSVFYNGLHGDGSGCD